MNFKKTLKCILLGAVGCSIAVTAAACKDDPNPGEQKNDPTKRPLTLSIGALDENFNPFFYTAANDGEVVGLTQISLIGVDRNAEIVCGDDENTVALAYRMTTKDEHGNETSGSDVASTTYEYVIKNGMKFSDGTPLTVKDVLFNFYVYLDPQYAGSTTLYATKIKGLSSYWAQRNVADGNNDYTSQFQPALTARMAALSEYSTNNNASLTPEIERDIATAATLFDEELKTDWTAHIGLLGEDSSYNEKYNFTEDWEVFYYETGFVNNVYVTVETSDGPMTQKKTDANGKYILEFDEEENAKYSLRTEMQSALNGLTGDARAEKMKEVALNTVFSEYFSGVEKDSEGKITKATLATRKSLMALFNEWNVGSNISQYILNQIMSDYYDGLRENGELPVESISGITTRTVKGSEFGKITAGTQPDANEEYSVLSIEINGVDPVAKYSFGITIAPMHYYSGAIDGVDYVDRAMNPGEHKSEIYGVKFNNQDFFQKVLKASSKQACPVGAGAYKSRNASLKVGNDCLYESNEYFHTVGKNLENAKIKYLNYRVVNEGQLVETLKTNGVDFAMPNCTPKNASMINEIDYLVHDEYDAGGFGYVGINPKYVPDLEVRQAIMKAMDIREVTNSYYTSSYAQPIYRPISTTSWVYDTAEAQGKLAEHFSEHKSIKYTTNVTELRNLVLSARETKWSYRNGKLVNQNGETLKLTFTIAGDTADHPAYKLFSDAADILNEVGFEITVMTNINALKSLATNELAVWAAAWSSGVDPDMYQLYHKDSKASAVNNWGYDVIFKDTTSKFARERTMITDLSKLVEDGRKYTDRNARSEIYYQALDKVMELAVELPTYQRKDMYVYNKNIIDPKTLLQNPNETLGVLSRIWEVNYV